MALNDQEADALYAQSHKQTWLTKISEQFSEIAHLSAIKAVYEETVQRAKKDYEAVVATAQELKKENEELKECISELQNKIEALENAGKLKLAETVQLVEPSHG